MKRLIQIIAITCILGCTYGLAATITVNSTNNADFSAGVTNLVRAITNLNNGDTIAFSISGAGPHYIETPAGGYPVLTKNNVTIDGYSQPGSSPNSNTILSSNNAVIKVVIDSRNGQATSNPGPGFGASEVGSFFVMGVSNHIRGLCFLGPGNSAGANDVAAVNIGNTAHYTHISGCWIGVDANSTMAPAGSAGTYDRGPTAFGDVVSTVPSWPSNAVIGVAPGPADTAGARAQQNVIAGGFVNIFMECMNMTIAGNKINVLPDGMHDVDSTSFVLESVIETGRVNNNMRVGTDGNGLNDAEERNVFGGIQSAGDGNIIEIYGQNGTVGRCTNVVVAGNYFGVAVDGVTRFTNSMAIMDRIRSSGGVNFELQFGSDFNGVSDDIEGNVIYMNNPFDVLYPTPASSTVPRFLNINNDGRVSLRGNKMVNNNLAPYSYADGFNSRLVAFTNVYAPYLKTTNGPIIPGLSASSTSDSLLGTCAAGNGIYTNIIIDVYVADPEGWTNGMKFQYPELSDGGSGFYGFPQGLRYAGSFLDNGPSDSNPAVGAFTLNIAALYLPPGTLVTVSANYSADPMGTTKGRTMTSICANPVTLLAPPGVIYVTTTNNASGNGLAAAITNLQDGNQIRFNIPGPGPHYIETPAGGYPVITKNNVTIDGYSQPGSSPNSNTILSSNNAAIKVVIDSRNGQATSNPGPGFGASEIGSFFVMGVSNHIRGLCFLGPGNSAGANDVAAVNIGNTAHYTHISGCWIGVDADGTMAPAGGAGTYDRGPTAFGDVVSTVPSWPSNAVIGVAPGPADTAGARAQQNVIAGGFVNIFMECMNMTIAGNKINVLPDGMHDVDSTSFVLESVIETGRVNNNMRVGTDGNGLNDAEERNVFGGISAAGDGNIIEIYGQNGTVGRCTNVVVAGNYFGVAVDGVTRFTNSMTIMDRIRSSGGVNFELQFGSDFNGVSDDIEGNVIYMNNPFDVLYPTPASSTVPRFLNVNNDGRVSLRGNKMVNNNLAPYSYADGFSDRLNFFTNFYGAYVDTNAPIIPSLSAKSTAAQLLGAAPKGIGIYSNVIIDVYLADPEGWTNGMKFQYPELSDGASGFYGFPQGKTYKGSVSLGNNFPGGSFLLDVAGFGLSAGDFVTVAANYSADPPGTTHGRTMTSEFAKPVTVLAPLVITSIIRSGSNLTISWSGGAPPYTLQRRSPITGAWSNVATGIAGTSTTTPIVGTEGFYRVIDP